MVGSGVGPLFRGFFLFKYIEIASGCSIANTEMNRSINEKFCWHCDRDSYKHMST